MSAFTYGGTDVGSSTYNVSLMGMPSTMGMADAKRAAVDRAGDGVSAFVGGVKNQRLTIECAMTASTAAAVWTQMDALRALLDPRNGVQLLVLDVENATALSGAARGYYALLDGPIYPVYYPRGCTFQLFFLVPDGVAVAATATTRTAVDATAAVYEPASAAAVVAGSASAHPVWTVKNTGDAVTAVTMTNVTTGQVCRWTGALATGAWLRLDADRVVVERSTDSGANWSVVTSGLTAADKPLTLRAGVRNEITVATLTAGTVDISYRAEYL
jgi:hypothetical protein